MYKLKTPRPNLYDYLKVIAIVAMIADHIGYYLFPEYSWLRIIGRVSFPLFLFLVGFNHSYGWKWSLFSMAVLVGGIDLLYHQHWSVPGFNANILVGIICARVLLSFVQRLGYYKSFLFGGLLLVAFHFINPFINQYFDYGGVLFIFALAGFLVRWLSEKKEVGALWSTLCSFLILTVSFLFHTLGQIENKWAMYFDYKGVGTIAWIVVGVLSLLTILLLLHLQRANTSIRLGKKRDRFIHHFSSWSLWIYSVHVFLLVLIKLLFLS